MDTHLEDLSPLSVFDAGPQGMLKKQACLWLWELPDHLGLKEWTIQLCSSTLKMSMRNSAGVSDVKQRYPLSVSQVMKLYSEVASTT